MAELETLKVFPRGDVTHTFDWGSHDITFFNGRVQKNRKRIHALRTLSFSVSGTYKTWEYLKNFYNSHHGCLDQFIFNYSGESFVCRFAEKISLTQKRELNNIVGFETTIALSIDNQKAPFNPLPAIKQFDFSIRGQIEDDIDWNTNVLDMNVKARGETWQVPVHKFSFTLSGTKKERDRLIKTINMYGDFVPFEFPANDEIYKCFLPSSVVIVDKREGQKVIGYSSQITLTSVNELQDIFSLKKEWAFLIGEEELFYVRNPVCFAVGKLFGELQLRTSMVTVVGKGPSSFNMKPYAVLLGRSEEYMIKGT